MLSVSPSHIWIGAAFLAWQSPSSVSGYVCWGSSPQLSCSPGTVAPSLCPGPMGRCFPTRDPKVPPTCCGLLPTSLGSTSIPWRLACWLVPEPGWGPRQSDEDHRAHWAEALCHLSLLPQESTIKRLWYHLMRFHRLFMILRMFKAFDFY